MIDTVLFDLGNTLVGYYTRHEGAGVLQQGIGEAAQVLSDRGIPLDKDNVIEARVEAERGEANDNRVRPLLGRLERIFQIDTPALPGELGEAMCRAFMKPIFALARLYDDSLPTLQTLRGRGIKTCIISNTPWGSPGALWREHLTRLELADRVDVTVFCTDVGYRKPAPQIFEHALGRMEVTPERCVFVGDDPRWDIAGPRAVGIDAILIDRAGTGEHHNHHPIHHLGELLERIGPT